MTDGRVLMELDQLYKKLKKSPKERLRFLRSYLPLVTGRDDLYTEYITLLNLCGEHEAALTCLMRHTFHPWEGGEGKVPAQYIASLCALAKTALTGGDAQKAIALLERTFTYPENLGEGKLYGAQENLQHLLLGEAFEQAGDMAQAKAHYEAASKGLSEPKSAVYYNDQPPETIFCQGLALEKCGKSDEAKKRFASLLSFADAHQNDTVKIDYFAVSLPDFLVFDEDLEQKNRVHCQFMRALGLLGLGEKEAATAFDALSTAEPAHAAAGLYRELFAGTKK